MRVLILSHDPKSFARIRNKLIVEGHIVVMFETLIDIASMLSFVKPDVAIVDTTSPGLNELLENWGGVKVCVIAVIASENQSRIIANANYVLRKPLRTKTLFRILAPLSSVHDGGGFFQNAKLDSQARSFRPYGDEREIVLTPIEFSLLEYLMENRNRPIDREELASKCCAGAEPRVVDVHIFNIRRKLGPAGHQIKAVRRMGYLFLDATASQATSG